MIPQNKNRMMHDSGYPYRYLIHLIPACSGSLDAEFPFDDVLDGGVDVGEILESPERDILPFAVGDEVWGGCDIRGRPAVVSGKALGYVPRPALAKSRSVSLAADRSDTPSPA